MSGARSWSAGPGRESGSRRWTTSWRDLDPEDIVISDDTGAVGLAGTMGGLTTEIDAASTDIVPRGGPLRPRRRVAHVAPAPAGQRGVQAVRARAGPRAAASRHHSGRPAAGRARRRAARRLRRGRPQEGPPGTSSSTPGAARAHRRAGDPAGRRGASASSRSAATVDTADTPWTVTPPSWRPDLSDPADLDEEVIRLVGYDTVPGLLPHAPPGRGLTDRQRLRRRIGLSLAHAGFVETPTYPFMGQDALDALGLPADDTRRHALRLANPLSDAEPLLRTTLLPGLLTALRRNVGRGAVDVALFEIGAVFRPGRPAAARTPALAARQAQRGGDRRPRRRAARPALTRVAAVLAGEVEPGGWWGEGRPAGWADAVEVARTVAREARVTLTFGADRHEPWHPGRCAALRVDGRVVGHAGEIHPRVVAALGLPPRTCAVELDLRALLGGTRRLSPHRASRPTRSPPRTSRSSSAPTCRPPASGGAARGRRRAARVDQALRPLPR